jgi:hypothetical protein
MYFFRISLFRQLFVAFALFVFGWMLLRANMRHGVQISVPEILVAVVCWWLAYRAVRVGFRVLNAHARVTFGRN